MIDYPRGQDGAILPAQDCPFCSRNKISPKSKGLHASFLSQNIFQVSKKIFFDFSVGMAVENERTKSKMRMKTRKTKTLMSFKNTFCDKNWQIQK